MDACVLNSCENYGDDEFVPRIDDIYSTDDEYSSESPDEENLSWFFLVYH